MKPTGMFQRVMTIKYGLQISQNSYFNNGFKQLENYSNIVFQILINRINFKAFKIIQKIKVVVMLFKGDLRLL